MVQLQYAGKTVLRFDFFLTVQPLEVGGQVAGVAVLCDRLPMFFCLDTHLVFLRDIQKAEPIPILLKIVRRDERRVFAKGKPVNLPNAWGIVFRVFLGGNRGVAAFRAHRNNERGEGKERRAEDRDHLLFHDHLLLAFWACFSFPPPEAGESPDIIGLLGDACQLEKRRCF